MTGYQIKLRAVRKPGKTELENVNFTEVHIYNTLKRLERHGIIKEFKRQKRENRPDRVEYILGLKGIMVVMAFLHDYAMKNAKEILYKTEKGEEEKRRKLPEEFVHDVFAVLENHEKYYDWAPLFTEIPALRRLYGDDEYLALTLASCFGGVDVFYRPPASFPSSDLEKRLGRKPTLAEILEEKIEEEENRSLGEATHYFFSHLSSQLEVLSMKRIKNRNLLEFADWYYKSQREIKQKQLKQIDEDEARVKTMLSNP